MKTDSAQIQYDKMTKTPVNKLVLQLGLPTTVSMLVTSVYNMADTFFVSQLGTSVSGATGVVFALMAIINASASCSDMAQAAISAVNWERMT